MWGVCFPRCGGVEVGDDVLSECCFVVFFGRVGELGEEYGFVGFAGAVGGEGDDGGGAGECVVAV